MALILGASVLNACDAPREESDAPANDAARDIARELEREAATDTGEAQDRELQKKLERAIRRKALKAKQQEPVSRDIRIIGDGDIPAPEIEGDTVTRLAPPETAGERNARESARLPREPDLFHRPLVVSAGVITSGETTIRLAGIEAPDAGKTCVGEDGKWPCGNFARASLQRLVRSRTLTCEGERTGTVFEGSCTVGNTDLSRWLVSQGWAESGKADFDALEDTARKEGKGLWRK